MIIANLLQFALQPVLSYLGETIYLFQWSFFLKNNSHLWTTPGFRRNRSTPTATHSVRVIALYGKMLPNYTPLPRSLLLNRPSFQPCTDTHSSHVTTAKYELSHLRHRCKKMQSPSEHWDWEEECACTVQKVRSHRRNPEMRPIEIKAQR